MSSTQGFLTRLARAFGLGRPAGLDGEPDAGETAPAANEATRPFSHARVARYQIGQVVRHRLFPFRGVIFDVDPVFSNTEEWYQSIPEEVRPAKNQPYYHLFAENDKTHYVAYVSEQNLEPDPTDVPVAHPDIIRYFDIGENNTYRLKKQVSN